jgi:hypothetical protein
LIHLNVGAAPNDGTGLPLRRAMMDINLNFDEVDTDIIELFELVSLRAPLDSPDFSGVVKLPPNTSIGTISNLEISYLDGVNSPIQTQINNKENTLTAGTNAQYYRGDKTWQNLNTLSVVELSNLYFTNSRAISANLVGYVSEIGSISESDTILTAVQKLNGNITLKANIDSPTFTGVVTAPTFIGALSGNATTATKLQT